MPKATEKQLEYAAHIAERLGISMPDTMDKFVVGAFIAKNKEAAALKEAEHNKIIHEQIKREIPIIDIAKEMGYEVVRRGRYYTLVEHDSVRINPDTNMYIRNSEPENRGSVIDFVVNFGRVSKEEAITNLKERLDEHYIPTMFSVKTITEKEEKLFILPTSGPNMRNVYAYLTQSRYIDPEVVQYFVDRKMIYQDVRKNCVFVSYRDNEPVFACVKGTNTFAPFQGDITGSNYEHCWFTDNGAKRLYVTEAPIDTLSRMSMLLKAGENLSSYDYLAMAGSAKYESVIKHAVEKGYEEIIVGTDNDDGGRKSLNAIRQKAIEENLPVKIVDDMPKVTKDWNEELKYLFMKGYRYKDYIVPDEKQLNIMDRQMKALAEANTQEYALLSQQLPESMRSQELTDYMMEYLDKNYEKALDDFSMGKKNGIKEVLQRYNRQTPLKPKELQPQLSKGIEL